MYLSCTPPCGRGILVISHHTISPFWMSFNVFVTCHICVWVSKGVFHLRWFMYKGCLCFSPGLCCEMKVKKMWENYEIGEKCEKYNSFIYFLKLFLTYSSFSSHKSHITIEYLCAIFTSSIFLVGAKLYFMNKKRPHKEVFFVGISSKFNETAFLVSTFQMAFLMVYITLEALESSTTLYTHERFKMHEFMSELAFIVRDNLILLCQQWSTCTAG
jgi:hypothetical protein